MHIPRGRRHSLYVCFLVLHRVCVLDMHISLCYCTSLNACSDDHLLCYVIIVVISIWLFWCMIKLLTCFTSCLLNRNLLVILYLSFYYLLYLEGLMCFVQVFQVTSIHIPSASQLLIILKGRNLSTFSLYSVFCGLYPCCLYKLLGFVFICRLYGLYHALCSLYVFVKSALLTKCHVFSC